MNRFCQDCSAAFEVSAGDLEFYDRISPEINGRVAVIPPPARCPDCRQRRRLLWRNERHLYPDTCDLCGKSILSLYSPDKHQPVYCHECWWSDGWDAAVYGRNFDFSKSFSEQFRALQQDVPRLQLFAINNENSTYANHSSNNKNCYMGVAFGECEDCMYGHWVLHSHWTLDGLYLEHCEHCYECAYCEHCFQAFYSSYSRQLSDCLLCFECSQCESCIGCVQLRQKKNHILNRPASSDEVNRLRQTLLSSRTEFADFAAAFTSLRAQAPRRFAWTINCHNSSGSDLYSCKNAENCFNCRNLEDCRWMFDLGNNKDSADCYEHGWLVPSELNYQCHAGMAGYHLLFSSCCSYSRELLYCDLCADGCSNLFGCISLRRREHCVLNKQYSRENYHQLAAQIIAHMQNTGEWGEFFPPEAAPFGYQETPVDEYFPVSDSEAFRLNCRSSAFELPRPEAKRIILASTLPADIRAVDDEILDAAIECRDSKRLFRLTRQELKFYRNHGLPLPEIHPEARHRRRISLRPKRRILARTCNRCGTGVKSVFRAEDARQILCELCYQQHIFG